MGKNANFGYLMKHGIAPNGGGNRLNQYSLVYDVYFSGGGNGWPSLANLDTSGDGMCSGVATMEALARAEADMNRWTRA